MSSKKKNYNELQQELNEILQWFSNEEDFSLDVAVEKYQRGNEIINELTQYLADTKNKIKQMKIKP